MTKQRKSSFDGLKMTIPKQHDSLLNIMSSESQTHSLPQLKQHTQSLHALLQESKNRKEQLQQSLQNLETQHSEFVARRKRWQQEQKLEEEQSKKSTAPVQAEKQSAAKKEKKQFINDYFTKVKTPTESVSPSEKVLDVKQEESETNVTPQESQRAISAAVKEEVSLTSPLSLIDTTIPAASPAATATEDQTSSGEGTTTKIKKPASSQKKNGRTKAKQKKKVIHSDSESEIEFAQSSDEEFVPDAIMNESISESSEMEDETIIQEPPIRKKIQPLNTTLLAQQQQQQQQEEPTTPTTPFTPLTLKSEEEATETEFEDFVSPSSKRKRRRKRIAPTSSKRVKVSSSNTVDLNSIDSQWDDIITREKPKAPIDQFWLHLDKYYFRPVTSQHISPQVFLHFPEDDSNDPLYIIPPLAKTESSVMSKQLVSNGLFDEDDFAFLDSENDVQMNEANSNSANQDQPRFDVQKAARGFSRRHLVGALASSSQHTFTSTDFAERLLSSLVTQNSFLTVPEIVGASTKGGVMVSPDSKRSSRFAKPSRNSSTILPPHDDTEIGKYEVLLEARLPKQEKAKLEASGRELLAKTLPISDVGDADQAQIIDTRTADYEVPSRETLSNNLYHELSHIGINCNTNTYDSTYNELPLQDDEVSAELRILQNHLREHRNRIKQIFAEVREQVLKSEKEEIEIVQRRMQYVHELNVYKQNAVPQVIPD